MQRAIRISLPGLFSPSPGVVLADGPPRGGAGPPSGKGDSKISPLLRGLIREADTPATGMKRGPLDQTRSVDSKTPRSDTLLRPEEDAPKFAALSERPKSGVIRFDNSGNVQVYVYANTTGEGELAVLKSRGVIVDLVNEEEGIVQGWVLPENLDAVADTGQLAAVTITVDSTGDGSDTNDGVCDDGNGVCTLRAAIQQTNSASGGIIEFDIAGTTPHTIQPGSALPDVTGAVNIDGQSQAPSSDGSMTALVQVEIDGTNAGAGVDGLTFSGTAGGLRGLAIKRFDGDGVVLESTGAKAVEDNLIGTDTTGAVDQGNGGAGISVSTSDNSIFRNVVSGNGSHGISLGPPPGERPYRATTSIPTPPGLPTWATTVPA